MEEERMAWLAGLKIGDMVTVCYPARNPRGEYIQRGEEALQISSEAAVPPRMRLTLGEDDTAVLAIQPSDVRIISLTDADGTEWEFYAETGLERRYSGWPRPPRFIEPPTKEEEARGRHLLRADDLSSVYWAGLSEEFVREMHAVLCAYRKEEGI